MSEAEWYSKGFLDGEYPFEFKSTDYVAATIVYWDINNWLVNSCSEPVCLTLPYQTVVSVYNIRRHVHEQKPVDPFYRITFSLTDEYDAMLFKLTWC